MAISNTTSPQDLPAGARMVVASGQCYAVSPDGAVRVWDRVAGHYTTTHGLSESEASRIATLPTADSEIYG